jgi:hypothetical protein
VLTTPADVTIWPFEMNLVTERRDFGHGEAEWTVIVKIEELLHGPKGSRVYEVVLSRDAAWRIASDLETMAAVAEGQQNEDDDAAEVA